MSTTLQKILGILQEQRKASDDTKDKEKFWKGIEDVIQREDQEKKLGTQIKQRTIPDVWHGPKYKGTSEERKKLGVDDAWGYSPADYLKSIGMLEHKIVQWLRKNPRNTSH